MFTNILFLILALLLINTVSEGIKPWIASEWLAFGMSVFLYICLCVVILLTYYALKGLFRKRPGVIQIIVNLELLIYLIIYQYILDAGRIFQMIPYMENTQTLKATWELILYLGGLAFYYGLSSTSFRSFSPREPRLNYAFRQLRFLLPFAIPFILITIVLDIFNATVYPDQTNSEMFEWISAIFSIVFVIILMIFLPFFIQKIWLCKPLPSGELKDRLTKLCQRAGFKHAGMKTWTIMHDQLTAGIIGIIPRYRYIMFTDRLLNELPSESIEAILAHEIGHSKRKHLLLFPFILAGMIVCIGLFFYFFSEPLINILEQQNALYPSVWWDFFNPLLIFSLYATIIIVYFRFVFGYFSRLFERQADLHVFEVGIPPEHMIYALAAVAPSSGGYHTPNWHHFSINERVEFLKACTENPKLIQRYHRHVKIVLVCYFVLLTLASLLLISLM